MMTTKNGPVAMTLAMTLEATQKTIEHVVNQMNASDLRSVLRNAEGHIKVNVAKWKNVTARQFWKKVDSPLRSDCRHGGSVHWGWLMEAEEGGCDWEYSIRNQKKVVWSADASLVLILSLFGDAAEDDQKWNYEQMTGNVWTCADLDWSRSNNEIHWTSPYNEIQRRPPPKGMHRIPRAIEEYEKTAKTVFGVWGEHRSQDTDKFRSEYGLYATKTALALGDGVYCLAAAGMYGAAFALARASWESAANAHYVWNEEPSQQVLRFLHEESNHRDRPIPLPKSQAGWKHPMAKEWARLKGTSKSVLAELAKGGRVQGQRWIPKLNNLDHCPYSEGEITNLVQFAEMNLMFTKASYFHFEDAASKETLLSLMAQWKPEWPVFKLFGDNRNLRIETVLLHTVTESEADTGQSAPRTSLRTFR